MPGRSISSRLSTPTANGNRQLRHPDELLCTGKRGRSISFHQDRVRTLTRFFHQDAHLRMRRLQIYRELVMMQALAGGGTDGGDDHFPAGFPKLLDRPVCFQKLHHMINLGRIRNQHHLHIACDDRRKDLSQRDGVFRQCPPVDRNRKTSAPRSFNASSNSVFDTPYS